MNPQCDAEMSEVLSLAMRPLRPRYIWFLVDSPVRKGRVPPYHRSRLCCAFGMTAFNLVETRGNPKTRLLYEPLEGVERLEEYRHGGYHPVQIG